MRMLKPVAAVSAILLCTGLAQACPPEGPPIHHGGWSAPAPYPDYDLYDPYGYWPDPYYPADIYYGCEFDPYTPCGVPPVTESTDVTVHENGFCFSQSQSTIFGATSSSSCIDWPDPLISY